MEHIQTEKNVESGLWDNNYFPHWMSEIESKQKDILSAVLVAVRVIGLL